jgi:hypothetical protein
MAATLPVSTSAKPGEPNMTVKKTAPKPNAPGGASKQSKGRTVASAARAEVKPQKKKTRPSALNAAARILAETEAAMNCQELIAVMAKKGYWTSPAGRTPQATLYSAIAREIKTKGADARFRKAGGNADGSLLKSVYLTSDGNSMSTSLPANVRLNRKNLC